MDGLFGIIKENWRRMAKQSLQDFKDAAEYLWVVLANVSEGDWTKQSKEWQKAAARARDGYFNSLTDLDG